MNSWWGELVRFWFGLEPEQWWKPDPKLDERIREDFEPLWNEKRQLPADHFLDQPLQALAAVILFDQLPRNMFRGHAEQFATDHLALAIAKGAIARDFDEQLEPMERAFLYMPFQHSESIADQQRSVQLFTRLGDAEMLRYARLHHDVIERFGRFPHRNAMLGRQPRADEIAAGDLVPW